MGAFVLAEGFADGPKVVGVGDISRTCVVEVLDDLAIKADAGDSHEDVVVVDACEIEGARLAVEDGIEGCFD